MKRFLLLFALTLPVFAQSMGGLFGPPSSIRISTFANLSTPVAGHVRYCTDCTAGAPCTGSGIGAFAFRVGSAWNCTSTFSGGASLPVADTTSIVEGSVDPTKEIRFEVDGLTTGTVRVITPPDSNTSIPIIPQIITVTGPTAARTWTVPDAAFTLARTDAAQTFTGVQTFSDNILGSGTANRIGTATTADAGADTLLSAAATTTTPLVLQVKATPTADWFRVEGSAGSSAAGFRVQSDGGVIINQQTGATFANVLAVQYQGATKLEVSPTAGLVLTNIGMNVGGGFFTVDTNGNAAIRHIVATGVTPSVGGSCGTSPTITGKDTFFRITTGTGSPTSCTVTFGNAYATAPACVANAATTTTALNVATTTTSVTISAVALTAGEVLHVTCGGF